MFWTSDAWRLIGSVFLLAVLVSPAHGEDPPSPAATAGQDAGPDNLPPAEVKALESWSYALALNAAREGMTELAERIGNVPGTPPLNWRPSWVVGDKARFLRRQRHAIRALTIAEVSREAAYRWRLLDFAADLVTGNAVFLGADRGTVFKVDLATGEQSTPFRSLGDQAVTAIRYREIAGQPLLLLATGRQHQAIDLLTGRVIQIGSIDDPSLALPPATSDLILLDGVLVKVTGASDGTITVQNASSAHPLPEGHGRGLTVVACQYVNRRPLAFTGGRDAKVRIWDLTRPRLLDVIDVPGHVLAIEVTREGDLVVLAGTEAIAFRHASAAPRAIDRNLL